MIRIAIADDHALFAEGVRDALHTQPDLVVKIVESNGIALQEAMTESAVDVALVDFEMPGGGLDLIRSLSGKCKVIVVTMYPEGAAGGPEAGAAGILTKSTPLLTLAAAIRAVNAGIDLPDGDDLAVLVARYSKPVLDPGAESLTEREIELLQVLARGISSTEELAETLYISQKTVKNHLASIFSKLAVSDRTQAAIEAIRLGIASPR
jgi:DNA-binding NarL/FixJ family response regulator